MHTIFCLTAESTNSATISSVVMFVLFVEFVVAVLTED